MTEPVRIDMVSDIACPWCAIGLTTLENALKELQGSIAVEVHLQPFELNPDMPKGGEEVISYLSAKYGIEPDQVRINQQRIYDRAKEVGFEFHPEGRKHVYNTFDCHRLLHWAATECGVEQAFSLKKALLAAYFTRVENMDDLQTLLDAVQAAGLDTDRAAQVLSGDEFAQAVRSEQTRWKMLGIRAVPAFILDNKFLVEGAQPQENLVAAIRQASERSQSQG
ncbi:DsbA family oxidoreductase [Orrella marina]|uniref:Disulfide bond formation protein DsbA n=1 Tax=Orrella marina TaxID=2163011 RepID=A0A2R4XNI2_9BURK|nr:DsbA family oxidoreductase [Orrella marina]AWB35259.1 disulfide bond formation protein DsbA [Orrella marina]